MRNARIPSALPAVCWALVALPGLHEAASFHRDSLAVPESQKVTVSLDTYPGITQVNPRGFYHHSTGVVTAKDGSLVACYRLSDNHTSLTTDIMIARSTDGGRTWTGHQSIGHGDVWVEHGMWIAPQISALSDGRLVVICDWGHRGTKDNHPMLTDWQKPDRGMRNYLFWSHDNGKTWSKPEQIDRVGGEPGYVIEMSDGTLAYTRTSSQNTGQLENPPQPWGDRYYRNEIVFSHDGGTTWGDARFLADSPFHGDCEVGLEELAPGKLIAATRIGLGNGIFGHPSRLIFSDDHGKTWSPAELAPFYGQRIRIGRLQSGRLLATFRNRFGTPGSRAIVFDPREDIGFQPSSHIVDESRCELTPDALTLRTDAGKRAAVEFSLYPAQSGKTRVEITATLRVEEAETNAVTISAGCWVHFSPTRVWLGDRPEAGFDIDARKWHSYQIVRDDGTITIRVDGRERLREAISDIWVRQVRFGNRSVRKGSETYTDNRGVSHWRTVSAKVTNDSRDYSIDWAWTPSAGYPDQFRRDRIVVLDNAAYGDSGYSGWTQMPDGRIVVIDYTSDGVLESFSWDGADEGAAPFVRAYLVTEKDLVRAPRR